MNSAFVQRFLALGQSPRELKLVYALKLLESFADFSTSLNLVLYLTEDFGYTDVEAGAYYGAWGVATSVFGMLFGPAIDRLGVRYSLVIGGALLTLGRALLAGAATRAHVILSIFVLQPAGMALAIPVLSIAIRRTASDKNRSLAFAVFYAVMNVGALISGLGTDAFNSYLRERIGVSGARRALFATGCATSLLYTLVALLLFRELPVREDAATKEHNDGVEKKSTWQTIRETWADKVFWRLCAFTAALSGARSIFRHMDTTIPKWMKRTIGANARYGSVYSINPAIVIATVAPLQAYLAERDPYNIHIVGTAITTLAPLVLFVLPASYVAATLFMLLLSAGEVSYSSKTMEFGMLLAPEGREGVYGTLIAAPLFLVRLVSGATSGGLLAHYCPATPPRHCQDMWLVIAAISATTPLLLFALRRCIYADDVRQRIVRARQMSVTFDAELEATRADIEALLGGTESPPVPPVVSLVS